MTTTVNEHTHAVSDDDFAPILAQTRDFVRTTVLPREREILDNDRVPDDLRQQAKDMGLFGYTIPQEWGDEFADGHPPSALTRADGHRHRRSPVLGGGAGAQNTRQ